MRERGIQKNMDTEMTVTRRKWSETWSAFHLHWVANDNKLNLFAMI